MHLMTALSYEAEFFQNLNKITILSMGRCNNFGNIGKAHGIKVSIAHGTNCIVDTLFGRLKLDVFSILPEAPAINFSMRRQAHINNCALPAPLDF